MHSRSSLSSRILARTGLVLAAAAIVGTGLYVGRHHIKALREAFSPTSAWGHYKGADLYEASEHFLKRAPFDRKVVSLTIDDGPHPDAAPILLDTLKKYQVPATFFVVGTRVKAHPELVKRMIEEGHEVGNHTQDHLRLDGLTRRQVENEIRDCEINVEKATGRRMTFMRPPGMRFNKTVLSVVGELGYTLIGWNIGAKDFIAFHNISDMTMDEARLNQCTPEIIQERVLKQLKPGVIILLHDNPVTVAALPSIIEHVREEGYEFVSTTELMHELPNPLDVVANPPATRVVRASVKHSLLGNHLAGE